jgi:hypothetical protein
MEFVDANFIFLRFQGNSRTMLKPGMFSERRGLLSFPARSRYQPGGREEEQLTASSAGSGPETWRKLL